MEVIRRGAKPPGSPAEAASAAEPAPAPAAIEHVNLAGDALFATGLATLTPAALASLDKLLNEREDRTYTQVTVTGYTDSAGSDASNLALSKRRAETFASYLKAHGLKARALSVTGRGSADPVASNATAEGRASNRRVDISLQR